jgi:hypothetical protein
MRRYPPLPAVIRRQLAMSLPAVSLSNVSNWPPASG